MDHSQHRKMQQEIISPAYCQKANAMYPAEKVEIMRRLIDEFSRMK